MALDADVIGGDDKAGRESALRAPSRRARCGCGRRVARRPRAPGRRGRQQRGERAVEREKRRERESAGRERANDERDAWPCRRAVEQARGRSCEGSAEMRAASRVPEAPTACKPARSAQDTVSSLTLHRRRVFARVSKCLALSSRRFFFHFQPPLSLFTTSSSSSSSTHPPSFFFLLKKPSRPPPANARPAAAREPSPAPARGGATRPPTPPAAAAAAARCARRATTAAAAAGRCRWRGGCTSRGAPAPTTGGDDGKPLVSFPLCLVSLFRGREKKRGRARGMTLHCCIPFKKSLKKKMKNLPCTLQKQHPPHAKKAKTHS